MGAMEINFQWPETKAGECKGKSSKKKGRSGRGKKLVGIRQRPSGRWVAEIKDTTKNKKIRMWLGTFETAEEAARAYDEAACLLRGSNTRTNFIIPQFSTNSPIASRIRTLLNNNNNNNNNNNKKTASPESLSSSSAAIATSADVTIDQDEAYYKPDMSNCNWDLSPSCSYGDDHGFSMVDEVVMKLPENTASFSEDLEDLLGFERMKVERQISASLYAMNGVHEYMEAVHDPTSQSIWDLPFFSSLQY